MVPANRTSAFAVFACLLFAPWAAGCGGSKGSEQTTPSGGGDDPLKVDQGFTTYDPIPLEGVRFEPEALGRPGMLRVKPKRKTSLPRQRRRVKRKRVSPVDVQILTTLLWTQADNLAKSEEGGAEKARTLRTEALELLREQRERSKGKTGAITLQMLASAELWAEETTNAVAVYEELLERFPEEENAPTWKTWLALTHLRAGRIGKAAEILGERELKDQDYLGAYVTAWVAFRQGEGQAARDALVHAAKSWQGGLPSPLQRDLLVFFARTGASVDESYAVLEELADGQVNTLYAWMFQLSEAYKLAGHYESAAEALDVIVDKVMAGKQVPPDDLVGFRFRQADYHFRLNRPARAAELAIAAYEALEKCPAERCPPKVRESVRGRVDKLAVFYHTAYHTTLDERYFDPAKKLYEFEISLGQPDADKTKKNLTNLEDTKARANPKNGKHDEKLMLDMVMTRREEITACYEQELQRDGELEGSVKLTIEVNDEGEVKGGSSDPAAGQEGLAAVGGCLVERARAWSFPGRTAPGQTVLTLPLVFSEQAAQG